MTTAETTAVARKNPGIAFKTKCGIEEWRTIAEVGAYGGNPENEVQHSKRQVEARLEPKLFLSAETIASGKKQPKLNILYTIGTGTLQVRCAVPWEDEAMVQLAILDKAYAEFKVNGIITSTSEILGEVISRLPHKAAHSYAVKEVELSNSWSKPKEKEYGLAMSALMHDVMDKMKPWPMAMGRMKLMMERAMGAGTHLWDEQDDFVVINPNGKRRAKTTTEDASTAAAGTAASGSGMKASPTPS